MISIFASLSINLLNSLHLNKDQDLLLRLRKGDEVAFELVFYRYKGKLYNFIRHSLPADEDAEGLVQEVFTRLWINREQLDPEKSLNAFLYTLARNEMFGYLRKLLVRRKYLEGLNSNLIETGNSTERQFEYEELEKEVNRLIGEMPEKRRKIFELSRNEGLSYKEIAHQLGISENTVDTQIRKALGFLREQLRTRMSVLLFFLFSKRE